MQRIWVLCLLMIAFTSCKDKKASLSGNETVNAQEFFDAFKKLKLPFSVADTNLTKVADTITINYAVVTQFVPDSVLISLPVKDIKKAILRAVGKIEKEDEHYLLLNITVNKKTSLYAFLFDKKNKYLAYLPLIDNKNSDTYMHSVSINNEPTFIISREKTTNDNKYLYTKNGLAYNKEAGEFIAVINDSNEDLKKINEIINPIDTLEKKNKYSGDYAQNTKNFISLRDGKDAGTYIFFIHFEKNSGKCTGELKGDLKMVAEDKAIYQQSGDPCVIDFTLSKNTIKVKERGSCGTHRGIKCFFDDRYTKKKEVKPLQKRKKT